MICDSCGGVLEIGSWPFCPDHSRAHLAVIGDECDVTQEHFSDQPERFRSKQAMARRAKELNLEARVQHVGTPGSDRSKMTQRWI
jgi:hypothetical protein